MLHTLKMLGNQPSKAEEIAHSARKWCSKNRLQSKQAEERLKWYQSLWNRREELNRQLISRIPELAG